MENQGLSQRADCHFQQADVQHVIIVFCLPRTLILITSRQDKGMFIQIPLIRVHLFKGGDCICIAFMLFYSWRPTGKTQEHLIRISCQAWTHDISIFTL